MLTEKAMLTDDSQRMPGWRPRGVHSRGLGLMWAPMIA
jgi:hypothetical protein